ncbi:hypothetical protein [Paenibacillus sp. MMS20-IR301]|uniref:hypothetical protein n=1 Tax=Paenibacillus sp. MMS20-IR301 TaxID=2895946 RepID=UPI0028EB5D4B|nr:hypothetical protein [Paenibacillus sp. MMS20-IR301]WNS46067.1 hypothetical protein LOS79_12585 [Paenibacillus sp. MMS20-IR301]
MQLLFSLLSSRFYSFIAYIDNNQESSGSLAGTISILVILAAAVSVIWFGRRHYMVLMFLSVELASILYKLCLYPAQILRPANLVYCAVTVAVTVFFLVKMPLKTRTVKHEEPQEEQEPESESPGGQNDLRPGAAARFGMLLLYILAAVPVLYNIYSKYADYDTVLILNRYLKLSYTFVLLSIIYLLITNTYLRDHLRGILALIVLFTIAKFVIPLFYFVPGVNVIAYYAGYCLVYVLLAVLVIALLYSLLRGRRLPLLAGLAERISVAPGH